MIVFACHWFRNGRHSFPPCYHQFDNLILRLFICYVLDHFFVLIQSELTWWLSGCRKRVSAFGNPRAAIGVRPAWAWTFRLWACRKPHCRTTQGRRAHGVRLDWTRRSQVPCMWTLLTFWYVSRSPNRRQVADPEPVAGGGTARDRLKEVGVQSYEPMRLRHGFRRHRRTEMAYKAQSLGKLALFDFAQGMVSLSWAFRRRPAC